MKSDVLVQQHVLDELRWDTRVDAADIGVAVDTGVVILTGTVTDFGARLAAQEAAHRVFGVRDVANDIEVKASAHGQLTDAAIAQAVRQALVRAVTVPHDCIHSTVSLGRVTLSGQVETWTQREDAERAIVFLAGVRGIANLITVSAASIASGTIRAAIEDALERRADREAGRINVEVIDGTVFLSGEVRSLMERRAIIGAVGHAPGVQALDDRLRVNPYA